ncbi:hypothetical protein KEM60_02878 [Austwickia sp. TVS 96-490-7B]|uniref:META domain-containing protein n=1 Tax=Austwickia sp. TVS 96-490-7B TaxID=2830843 RepID=UPI001C56E4D6|nr:META domain-containing protein [Austwickia sp. TVS 96-490-7B]MBW3086649.1 hypothetical protein [Austwickia sp. TVS 96-490-7B]
MHLHVRPAGRILAGTLSAVTALAMLTAPGALAADSGITGKQWKLQNASAQPAYFQVDGDQLTGSGPCNSISAHAVIDGDQLTLDQVRTTRVGCEGKEGQTEQRMFAALREGTVTATVSGNTLTVSRESGQTTFVSGN